MSNYQNQGDNDVIEFEFEEELRQHVMNELSTAQRMPKKAKKRIERYQELRALQEITHARHEQPRIQAIEMKVANTSFSESLSYELE